MLGTNGNDLMSDTDGGADFFNLYYDIAAGFTDTMTGITVGTDFVILPSHINGNITFAANAGNAMGSITVGGGTYLLCRHRPLSRPIAGCDLFLLIHDKRAGDIASPALS